MNHPAALPTARCTRREAIRTLLLAVSMPAALLRCAPAGPRAVAVGVDSCAHCRMTIVDARFAAEAITRTGVARFFDSIDCLAAYLAAHPPEASTLALFVARFASPAEFLPVADAQFIEATGMRGPMGGPALMAIAEGDPQPGGARRWDEVRRRAR